MTNALARRTVMLGAGAITVLLVVVVANSVRWIGTTFPGFLLIGNRVVASIALPDWPAGKTAGPFQHQVLAVDGGPVETAAAVYDHVALLPPDTLVTYRLRAPDGRLIDLPVPTRRFSGLDYTLLFGAFLANGVFFLVTALLVVVLKPGSAASYGLASQSLLTALFVITAADLYGPHWFFRLHVLAEALMGAGFLHLALVFPTDRLRQRGRPTLVAVYVIFALLAAVYELSLASPSAYTAVHLLATATHGFGAAALVAAVSYDLVTSRSPLVRRRTGVVALGTLAAFVVPIALSVASAILGGSVPLNAGAFTAFLFPLSLGYAIVKEDLFEIDLTIRRAITYAVVLITVAGLYLVTFLVLDALLPNRALLARSPVALAILNLAFLLLLTPIKARVQAAVDHVFFRRRYDAERALAEVSRALVSAHSLQGVISETRRILGKTLYPSRCRVMLSDDGRTLTEPGDGAAATRVVLPADLAARLMGGAVLARYEWDDGSGRPLPALWEALDVELVLPLRTGAAAIGGLCLGAKESGGSYGPLDLAFLRAVADQVALALTNARAFDRLEELNANLEQQVRERTAALEAASGEVSRSLDELRAAYGQLERNQASLMRSERLATLGRLAAGIAHEVNTPLGAVITELKLLADLGAEYEHSIDDPAVTGRDHHGIARDICTTADAAGRWARKAAAVVGKVKLHGREPRPIDARPFLVSPVVSETGDLLAHRLRTAACELTFSEEPAGVTVTGDPTRLSQVFLNLVGNAIDAYEDRGASEGRIAVSATSTNGVVTLQVRDWAGGMTPEVAVRAFDDLFTTKDPGRGTGLGLWISRNLVEETFGGTLTVDTQLGVGSCFTIAIPQAVGTEAAPPLQG